MATTRDHNQSESQKEREWMRQQISELKGVTDNVYQNLAAMCRILKIMPEELVAGLRNNGENYTFLIACMKEEQRLNEEARLEALEAVGTPEDNQLKIKQVIPQIEEKDPQTNV